MERSALMKMQQNIASATLYKVAKLKLRLFCDCFCGSGTLNNYGNTFCGAGEENASVLCQVDPDFQLKVRGKK